MTPFFSSRYRTTKQSKGQTVYWFSTLYTQSEGSNENPPLSVDGEIFSADAQFTEEDTAQMFQKLPEEVYNPTVNKRVVTQWISDCSGAFIKPPTVEKCLENM